MNPIQFYTYLLNAYHDHYAKNAEPRTYLFFEAIIAHVMSEVRDAASDQAKSNANLMTEERTKHRQQMYNLMLKVVKDNTNSFLTNHYPNGTPSPNAKLPTVVHIQDYFGCDTATAQDIYEEVWESD